MQAMQQVERSRCSAERMLESEIMPPATIQLSQAWLTSEGAKRGKKSKASAASDRPAINLYTRSDRNLLSQDERITRTRDRC